MAKSFAFFVLLCFGLVSSQSYNLVWSDEFDGTSIDTKKWDHEVDCWGGGNNELQCYTTRAKNSRVENGHLIIQAIQESYTTDGTGCTLNQGCSGTKSYTSARLSTENIASWLYGKFEMRAKLPKGKMLWPAFWMLPTDNKYGAWAASGEIDIMEYKGQEFNLVQGTLHFGGSWPNNVYQGSGPSPIDGISDFSEDFHTFAVVWEKDLMTWLVDGNPYHSMTLKRNFYSGHGTNPYTTIRQPFDQRFHIILNLAVGGGFFPKDQYGTLTTAEARAWPNSQFVIDYIRVYQQTDVAPPPPTTKKPPKPVISSSVPQTTQVAESSPVVIDNQQVANSPTTKKLSTQAMGGIVGGSVGFVSLVAIVLVIFFVLRRRKSSNDQSNLTTESSVPKFSIGTKCRARYSGDSQWYDVIVQSVQGDKYLVNYGPKFGNDCEWVPITSLSS